MWIPPGIAGKIRDDRGARQNLDPGSVSSDGEKARRRGREIAGADAWR
jgi:hypothetical protein